MTVDEECHMQQAARRDRPFVAQIKQITTTTAPDGSATSRTEVSPYYRDSLGRQRTDCSHEVEPGVMARIAKVSDFAGNRSYFIDLRTGAVLFDEPLITSAAWAEVWGISECNLHIPILPLATQFGRSLGAITIEGLICDGYRRIEPMRYEVEYWYSRDLNRLVRVTALFGSTEVRWQLINIRRVEPDAGLFVRIR